MDDDGGQSGHRFDVQGGLAGLRTRGPPVHLHRRHRYLDAVAGLVGAMSLAEKGSSSKRATRWPRPLGPGRRGSRTRRSTASCSAVQTAGGHTAAAAGHAVGPTGALGREPRGPRPMGRTPLRRPATRCRRIGDLGVGRADGCSEPDHARHGGGQAAGTRGRRCRPGPPGPRADGPRPGAPRRPAPSGPRFRSPEPGVGRGRRPRPGGPPTPTSPGGGQGGRLGPNPRRTVRREVVAVAGEPGVVTARRGLRAPGGGAVRYVGR